MGGRGDGRSAASHNNFWQLFVRPAGTSTWRLATPPGWPATAAWSSPACRPGRCWPGSGPARTWPTPRSPPPRTTAGPGHPACSMPGWLMSPAPWPLTRPADACWRCSPTAPPRCPARRDSAGPGWPAARPSPSPRRNPVPAGQPHRRRVQPIRAAHAGRGLQPSRNRRDLLLHRRDVAAHRPHATRRLRPPGHHRPPAHHHGTAPPRRCLARNRAAAHLLAAWSTDGGTHWTLSPPLPLTAPR